MMKMYMDMVVPFIAEKADNVEYLSNNSVWFQVENHSYYIMTDSEKVVLTCEGVAIVAEYFRDNIRYFLDDIYDILDR